MDELTLVMTACVRLIQAEARLNLSTNKEGSHEDPPLVNELLAIGSCYGGS